MTIKSLLLRNFRNYREEIFTFSPHINMILGNNAQGKTNLLEAIYLLITGRSFRTSHLNELIHFEEKAFYVEAIFEKHGIDQTVKFSFDGQKRAVFHNFTALPNLSSLLGILNGVILAPEDHDLIKGLPQIRRQFLDLLIAQSNPLYLYHLSRYHKAMKQRNFLLKQHALKTITAWEEQMASAAVFLTVKRAQTLNQLENMGHMETLGSDRMFLRYRSQALNTLEKGEEALHNFFLKQFAKNRERECQLKCTVSGPHRDDFSILIHDKEARLFGSEGQQRSLAATIKLAQWQLLKNQILQAPTLCVDDLGTSFDTSREAELYKKIEKLGQIFITSTRSAPLPCHLIEICNGKRTF